LGGSIFTQSGHSSPKILAEGFGVPDQGLELPSIGGIAFSLAKVKQPCQLPSEKESNSRELITPFRK